MEYQESPYRGEAEQRLRASPLLLRALAEAQGEYIRTGNTAGAFERLLRALLELTGSEYGFIGEVSHTSVLVLHVACRCGPTPQAVCAPRGEELCELLGLLGSQPWVAHEPASAPPLRALPEGHPPPRCWLGLPLEAGGEQVGLVAMANAPGGYGEALISFLQPFLATCSSLLQARRDQRRRLQAEEELRRNQERLHKLALVAARTHNAVVITDAQGRAEWVNEGFTRITGYTLEEVQGRKPGELLQGPGTAPETARAMRERIHRGQEFSVELLNYHKSGRPYWISILSCSRTRWRAPCASRRSSKDCAPSPARRAASPSSWT